jgi:hypothetical protein
MTTQPADGSDFERLWEQGQPLGEAGGIETDTAGEAVPGEVRQVRFPRPG